MGMIIVQTSRSGEVRYPRIAEPVVRRTVRAACDRAELPSGQSGWVVDVTFVDVQAMRYYNEKYRGAAGATDVLAFVVSGSDLEEGREGFSDPTRLTLLGDIMICPQHMSEEQNELHEIALLACHGALHLLGWTHDDEGERADMDRVTEEVLSDVLPRSV